MKPLVSQKALQIGLVIVGTVLVAVGEAPQLKGAIPDLWQHLMAIAGTALLGKELLKRTGDYASTELPQEWVDAVEQVNAQGRKSQPVE